MRRPLLITLLVTLLLVAGAGTAFVLTTLQPRYAEETSNSEYNLGRAQDAYARGDTQEGRLAESAAAGQLDSATEIRTVVLITWGVVGLALVGAVVTGLALRRGRSSDPAPAGAAPTGDPAATTVLRTTPRTAPPPHAAPRTPAGWYADAHGTQRWFDGVQWTPYVR